MFAPTLQKRCPRTKDGKKKNSGINFRSSEEAESSCHGDLTEKKMDPPHISPSAVCALLLPRFLSLSPLQTLSAHLRSRSCFWTPLSGAEENRGNFLKLEGEEKKKLVCSCWSLSAVKEQRRHFIQNMTNPLEKAVAQKKEAIEAVMDMFQRGAEVLASAVGELFPLCEAAAPVLRLALDNVHSKEVFYVKEQFLTVKNKLDVLSSQLEDIDCEIKKGKLDSQYFSVEENIRNQFRKYMDILEAKEQFKEVKKRLFLEHFAKTGGEKNLRVLCDALMGTNCFGESILDVVEGYVARNRRLLEDFCVWMKELLCLGLIALLGHCALTQGAEEEQDKIQEWSSKIEEVESRMKSAIESCIAAFPEQAKLDTQRLLQENQEDNLQDTSQQLLEFLVKKYDWVSWSVRLINHSGSTYRNWRAGEHFHHVAGQNWFEVLQVNNISLVVSHSTKPQPVPRDWIRQLMEAQGKKGNAPAVVEVLEKQLCGFVVHAVSRHKESAAAWSFPEDCHYWERHKNVAVCVHSE